MKCPFCNHAESKVIDSRELSEGDAIRRRRECEACSKRFTSYERVEQVLPMVIKKDSRREPFDRFKVVSGLKKACEKRPVSIETIESIINHIESQLQEMSEKEVSSNYIGEMVMQALHEKDAVAYVRFASVYRSFKDVNEFMQELTGILKNQHKK